MINSRDLKDLRSDVRVNAIGLIKEAYDRGLPVLVVSTMRDDAYQATLYAQGRTKPGSIITNSPITTFHGQGLAFDFCKNIRGHEYDDVSFFKAVGELAKEMGFTWGGDWKSFTDRPHIQWDNKGNYSTKMLLAYKNKQSNGIPCPGMPAYSFSKTQDEEEEIVKRYMTLDEIPSWYRSEIEYLVTKGYLNGGEKGLDLSEDMIRILVVQARIMLHNSGT